MFSYNVQPSFVLENIGTTAHQWKQSPDGMKQNTNQRRYTTCNEM